MINRRLISFWLLIIIGVFFLSPVAVLASDVSDAKFYGIIQTTNNGTAASNVVTTITGANVTALIAGGFMNSSATNCAIQSSTGADAPFMPGYGTNPTVIYNGSLGANTITNSLFYTKNVTGGNIVYFPGNAGATVPDTMVEPGNNFRLRFNNALINTDNGSSKNIVSKTPAFDISIDPVTSGKVNFSVYTGYYLNYVAASNQHCRKDSSVVSPTGNVKSFELMFRLTSLSGANQYFVCDGLYGSYDGSAIGVTSSGKIVLAIGNSGGTAYATQWVSNASLSTGVWYFLTCSYDATASPRLHCYLNGAEISGTDTGSGGAVYNSTTYLCTGGFYDGSSIQNLISGDLDEVRISNTVRTLADNIAFYNDGMGQELSADAYTVSLWHFNEGSGNPVDAKGNNNLTRYNNPTWTAGGIPSLLATTSVSGITTGQYNIVASLTGGTLSLSVGTTSNTTACGGSVPNSAANWVFCEGGAILYVESIEYERNGAKVDLWDWEYGATFTGDTTGNIMTPSFPTTGNDADCSSELILFQPVAEPTAPAFAVDGGPDFLTDNITVSGTPNSVNGSAVLPNPIKRIIDDIAGTTPKQMLWLAISTFVLLGISIAASHFLKETGGASIFAKSAINIVLYGILVALHIFDWWMLVFFFIFEQAIWFAAKERKE